MKEHPTQAVLYKKTVDPIVTDGRDIDCDLAELSGEGSHQSVAPSVLSRDGRRKPATHAGQIPAGPAYYDLPMLKKPVWSIDIPLYYFVGGAAGAALVLGAAVQVRNEPGLRELARDCHWIGIAGSTLGAGFLIHDLGVPSRFLNMVRVFRPTSPMNIGAWILGGAAPTAIATGLLINRPGWLGAIGEIAGYLSGLFGAGLTGYTGVLVANSAIPVWQQARQWMPVLFVASSIASAGSLLSLVYDNPAANRVTFLFGTAGRLAELAAAHRVEKSAAALPKVNQPLHSGATGVLWKAATGLAAASLVLSVVPGKSSGRRKLAGLLGTLGSLAMRFAVHYISNASARDPRASFHQQRARMSSVAGQ
ncbi:MAG TPA: NrfD/PsrC family molybdoenzyme membrane anchor subunit [Bryobacteraceae bacterium]|nr:NrfD/PsrC family molybdoenzyme membrane anchor subunit [Bryobacteraceae bacterium]